MGDTAANEVMAPALAMAINVGVAVNEPDPFSVMHRNKQDDGHDVRKNMR